MSGDIVERLRGHFDSMCMNNIVCGDAADEIERLRGEVERWAWIAADAARSGDALMQHMRRYDDLALKRWREEPIRER